MVLERNFLGADAGIFRQNEVLMKKIPLKRIFAAAALVCCLTVTTAYADVTQEDIDNAKNQINNLKNQQKDAQDAVDDINGKKGQLESDLNNLNGQMTNIVSSMNALEIRKKNCQILRMRSIRRRIIWKLQSSSQPASMRI